MLDALSLDRVTLMGSRFRGWVAAGMAIMSQRRFDQLVLVGAAGIQPRAGAIVDQLVIDYIDYVRLGFADEDTFTQYFGEDPPRDTRMLLYGGREMTMRLTFKPWMFNRALPMLLRGVRTPALIVWGRHDRIVPLDCGEQYAEALPHARLVILDDAGHFVDMERPGALAEPVMSAVPASRRTEAAGRVPASSGGCGQAGGPRPRHPFARRHRPLPACG